jgi:hypothetical protein
MQENEPNGEEELEEEVFVPRIHINEEEITTS